jgi:hypothetical protein
MVWAAGFPPAGLASAAASSTGLGMRSSAALPDQVEDTLVNDEAGLRADVPGLL